MTAIPVASSFLLKLHGHGDTWLTRKAIAVYMPALRWALGHERIVLAAALAMLATAGATYVFTGRTFMPEMDEGTIIVDIKKIPSASLEDSAVVDLMIHKAS